MTVRDNRAQLATRLKAVFWTDSVGAVTGFGVEPRTSGVARADTLARRVGKAVVAVAALLLLLSALGYPVISLIAGLSIGGLALASQKTVRSRRVRYARFASWLAIICCWAVPSAGQVNVEPLRAQIRDRGFGGRLGASAATYAGNTRGVVLGSAALVGLRSARNFAYLSTSGNYSKLGGVIGVANWFLHVRHNYELSSFSWWEEFGQIESDRFQRLALRELVGTGPRLQVIAHESFEAFYGAAYMFEYTNLSGDDGAQSGSFHRFSNYVAMTLHAHPKIAVTSVTYLQPRFDEPSDLRVLSILSADFQVTGRLHSRFGAKFRYASRPPSNVERSDFELNSSLELLF